MHPWQAPARQGTAADAYFLNLEDGAKIETPFKLDFGLAGGWGLAPITSPAAGKSGHHHLLVNRDLPLDFKKALPFNDLHSLWQRADGNCSDARTRHLHAAIAVCRRQARATFRF